MNFALRRMIVAIAPIVGLGLSACTAVTKEEHLEMHKAMHKEMMTSEEHKAMMQDMMKNMMMGMMKKEKMK